MKHKAAFIFGLLAGALLAGIAHADDTVSWRHPTQYTDSTALDPADIDATILRWFDGADSTTVAGSQSVAAPATSAVIPRDATPGTRCYQGATLMKSGAQSNFAPSAKVCKTIAAVKKSRPPNTLEVQ